MRTLTIAGLIILLTSGTVMSQHITEAKDRMLQIGEITYDVGINNHDLSCEYGAEGMADQWFRDNIEASSRCTYLDLLFEKAISGKLKITDTNGRIFNAGTERNLFYYCDTVRIVEPQPPYRTIDTAICSAINPQAVVALRFREAWLLNTATLEITKRIKAVAPLLAQETYEAGIPRVTGLTPICWIIYDEKIEGKTLLTPRIVTSTVFEKKRKIAQTDSVKVTAYISTLIDKSMNGSISCYTFNENPLWDIPLSADELFARLYKVDTMRMIRSGMEYDTVVITPFDPEKLRTLRFMEAWYFDEATLQITKQVTGLCPVLESYRDDGEFRGYIPLFWTYFNDIWMPFGQKPNVKTTKTKP